MQKPVTVTDHIKVLRSGSPWSGAIAFGVLYGLIPWIFNLQTSLNFPVILAFLPLVWLVQAAFGQFTTWGYEYDLKRTNPKKTTFFYLGILAIFALLLGSLLSNVVTDSVIIISILAGTFYMLLTKYLAPWTYKEPRDQHFPNSPESPSSNFADNVATHQ